VRVSALESEMAALSDGALRSKTADFRGRTRTARASDELMPEAFAVAREAARRATGMRPFDVQSWARFVLHKRLYRRDEDRRGQDSRGRPSRCTSMRWAGKGVHVVTVNDYLASRDAAWMGPVYEFLG